MGALMLCRGCGRTEFVDWCIMGLVTPGEALGGVEVAMHCNCHLL